HVLLILTSISIKPIRHETSSSKAQPLWAPLELKWRSHVEEVAIEWGIKRCSRGSLKMCSIEDFKQLELDDDHRVTVEQELEGWHEWYLPVKSTVLDIGAGCGETAFFYLNHGARKVICVESDPKAVELLKKNFGSDSRVVIVDAHVDSIKIDIEGSERDMILETHFPFRLRKIKTLIPNVVIWKLEEYWGNIFTRAIRKTRIWRAKMG
ncbi:MAG TPA: hypothetical protein VGS11_06735, partial [Candidatus Bathyarchaeia archaeon]|nr:hypothetical protein [Candidatus Bathyarchaeia archaeon]